MKGKAVSRSGVSNLRSSRLPTERLTIRPSRFTKESRMGGRIMTESRMGGIIKNESWGVGVAQLVER